MMTGPKGYIAVNNTTGYVIGFFVGNPTVPGLTFIERSLDNRFVQEGFRFVNDGFVDDRASYDQTQRFFSVGAAAQEA